MDEKEQKEREAVVAEAKTWFGTPYHVEGRVKGAGVDCGMFILQTFENTGLMPHIDIPHYPIDIACNCAKPMYLNKIKEYCKEVDRDILPGDVIVMKFPGAKVPHHAAIAVNSEYMIHSHVKTGVIMSNIKGFRQFIVGVYSFWQH